MIYKKLIIASAIRNGSLFVKNIINNIISYSSLFKDTYCIFVESDSNDDTISILEKEIKNTNINYKIYSLGNTNIIHRTERIAKARNYYLDIIENDFHDWDYLLVLDFNDSNIDIIDEKSILSNFQRNDWDMVCANQKQGYYDLWALRHPKLMPYDCWHMVSKHVNDTNYYDILNKYVYSNFFIIPESMDWIKVNSAFGGSAFIKISSIKGTRHSFLNEEGYEECEWVSFCYNLNNNVSNIFINPQFLNQTITKSRHIL